MRERADILFEFGFSFSEIWASGFLQHVVKLKGGLTMIRAKLLHYIGCAITFKTDPKLLCKSGYSINTNVTFGVENFFEHQET